MRGASLRNDDMSAIEASARTTLISNPDRGSEYIRVCSEAAEVEAPSRGTSGILGHGPRLLVQSREEDDFRWYISF